MDIIFESKYNGNFHLEEDLHLLVTVDNQDMFDVEGKKELSLFCGLHKRYFRKDLLLMHAADAGR